MINELDFNYSRKRNACMLFGGYLARFAMRGDENLGDFVYASHKKIYVAVRCYDKILYLNLI